MLKTTVTTESLCPYKVAISFFVSMFHNLIALSSGPLAKIVPILLLKATEITFLLCPYRLILYVFVSMFQSLIA